MEWIIIIIMVLGSLSILGMIFSIWNDKDILAIICLFVSEICIIAASSIAFTIYINKEIKPIEVYRGNTTLQITYKDSIPIDSIVVYKNK